MKYIAELEHVLEVSLRGAADLAFWRDRLEPEGLFPTPAPSDGRAQLWISGASSQYMGIRFRELSVSIFVSRHDGATSSDGIFLAQAFNSSRLFTFFERVWFTTPYVHAGVHVGRAPTALTLTVGSDALLTATVGDRNHQEAGEFGHNDWEGPIFLPRSGRSEASKRRLFFARLAGRTRTCPFLPEIDVLKISDQAPYPALRWLVASNFRGEAWSIRQDAQHARSKTYRVGAAPRG